MKESLPVICFFYDYSLSGHSVTRLPSVSNKGEQPNLDGKLGNSRLLIV